MAFHKFIRLAAFRKTARLTLEALEDRLAPSITIQIDYSHDTNNFFVGHADRQAILQMAVNNLTSRLGDSLDAIVPNVSAGDTWTALFTDPATGNQDSLSNPTIPADTIILYAGGRNLGGVGELGNGGPGGYNAQGFDQAWFDTVQGRGKSGALGPASSQTAFAPWGGSVAFDTSFSNWYFGANPSLIAATQIDFLSAAEHEIGHVLGFGTSNAFTNSVSGSFFIGPAATREYGSNVPTDAAGAQAQHWADGTLDRGAHATMDPVFDYGRREAFTPLDFAGLQDIGWGVLPPPVTVGPGPYTSVVGVTSGGDWWAGVGTGSSFTNQDWASWYAGAGWQDVLKGDFNGDGLTDVAARSAAGDWWVGLNTGSTFTWSRWTTWYPGVTWVDVKIGDFNGDGKADIIGRVLQSGDWWVAQSTGSSFVNSRWSTWYSGVAWVDVQIGDFNGGGRSDIAGRVLQSGQWWVGLSTGANFTTSLWTTWYAGVTWVDVHVGDFNGDGFADLIGRVQQSGQWWVAFSNGSSAFTNVLWSAWSTGVTWVDVQVADFNGDGKSDIAGRTLETGQWWVSLSTGSGAATSLWATWSTAVSWLDVQIGDFNGDGHMDIIGRTNGGQWWAAINTSNSFTNYYWGSWFSGAGWQDVFAGRFH
jgi:hypothetical protein